VFYLSGATTNEKTYINGILATSHSESGTYFDGGTNTTLIGYDSNISAYMHGAIDNVKFYDYPRTQAQVAYDYNRGAPIAWYKMDECQGGVIHDASGNNNNGALSLGSNAPTSPGTCNTANSAWAMAPAAGSIPA